MAKPNTSGDLPKTNGGADPASAPEVAAPKADQGAGDAKRAGGRASGRRAIQADPLLQRLEEFALGRIEMSPGQIRAAEILLRKSVADLSTLPAIEGEPGDGAARAAFAHVPESRTMDSWAKRHVPKTAR